MVTIWIGFPPSDGVVRDKDVNAEPRDKTGSGFLGAVHVIPGNLHPICPGVRHPPLWSPSAVWLADGDDAALVLSYLPQRSPSPVAVKTEAYANFAAVFSRGTHASICYFSVLEP